MGLAAETLETLAALEAEGTEALRLAGIEMPRHEARLLLQHAAGVNLETLIAHPARGVSPAAAQSYRGFIRRRMEREPVAYILGCREFWSLEFRVSPAVLVPRPDSETLIEAALAGLADRGAPLRVLDLGTGSGCLLLALLSELPNATGVGLDVSPAALDVARANAQALGLGARAAFREGGWSAMPAEPFDIVLANPPYIPEPELCALERDVRDYEPHLALSGGADGLDAYRAILPVLGRVAAPHARIVFEHGAGQQDAVSALARAEGFAIMSRFCDLAGHFRALMLRAEHTKKTIGMGRPKG